MKGGEEARPSSHRKLVCSTSITGDGRVVQQRTSEAGWAQQSQGSLGGDKAPSCERQSLTWEGRREGQLWGGNLTPRLSVRGRYLSPLARAGAHSGEWDALGPCLGLSGSKLTPLSGLGSSYLLEARVQ